MLLLIGCLPTVSDVPSWYGVLRLSKQKKRDGKSIDALFRKRKQSQLHRLVWRSSIFAELVELGGLNSVFWLLNLAVRWELVAVDVE